MSPVHAGGLCVSERQFIAESERHLPSLWRSMRLSARAIRHPQAVGSAVVHEIKTTRPVATSGREEAEPGHSPPEAVVSENTTRLRTGILFLLSVPLLILNAFFGTYAYVVVQALIWTQTSLLRGPLVLLFCLVLANGLLIRFARRHALLAGGTASALHHALRGTCAGGLGFVQILISQMTTASICHRQQRWQATLWPHIPLWAAPRQAAV